MFGRYEITLRSKRSARLNQGIVSINISLLTK